MKLRAALILATTLFSYTSVVQAQQSESTRLEKIVLPGPDVTAFQRYGNWPMGNFTGTPNVSLPLFNLTSGSLQLPVTLGYNSGGVKINDAGSNLGTGWVISAGGQINRNMFGGQPDELTSYGYWAAFPASTMTDVYDEKYRLENYAKGVFDAQPDLFSISAAGLSGKFVFDKQQNAHFLPYTNLDVQKTLGIFNNSLTGIEVGQAIRSFTIIDNSGTRFFFTACDMSQTESTVEVDNGSGYQAQTQNDISTDPGHSAPNTWNLTQIVSADHKDTITLEYELKDMSYWIAAGSSIKVAKQTSGNIAQILPHYNKTRTLLKNTVRSNRLIRIRFRGGRLEFFEATGRKDMLFGGQILDSIVLKDDAGNRIKGYSFNYLYLNNGIWQSPTDLTTNASRDVARLFLHSFQETGNSENNPAHIFTYENSKPLPNKTLDGGDIWGYSNGKSYKSIGDSLVAYYYDNFGSSEAALRKLKDPNFDYARQGVLTKIEYPTGGSSKFDYEPHYKEARTQTLTQTICEGNVNVIFSGVNFNPGPHGNDPDQLEAQKFRVSTSAQVEITVSLNDKYANFPSYYFVEIRDSASNSLKYTYYNTSLYCDTYSSTPYPTCTKNITLASGTYYIIAKNSGQTYSGPYDNIFCRVSIGTFNCHTETTIIDDSISVGGFRVKLVTDSGFNGSQTMVKRYTYENGIKPSAFSGLFLSESDYYYMDYSFTTTGGGSHSEENEKILTSNSIYPLIDIGNSYVCYGTVTEAQLDPLTGFSNGYTKYIYSNDIDDGLYENDYAFRPYPPYVAQTWRRGNLLRTETYDRENHIIRKSVNYYSILKSKGQIDGQAFFTKYHQFPGSMEFVLSSSQHDFLSQYFTVHKDFHYTSSYFVLDSTEATTYDELGHSITKTDRFDYDTTTLLTRSVITDKSSGEKEKIVFYRPLDYQNLTASDPLTVGIKNLKEARIYTPEVEISRYILNADQTNQRLISSNFTVYNSTALVKAEIRSLETTSPVTNFLPSTVASGMIQIDSRYKPQVFFTRYNDRNRLVEQQKVNDVKEVYVWGYNSMYPVAKVIGSDYNTVSQMITQNVLDNPSSEQALNNETQKVRNGLASSNVLVTTYAYRPLVGMSTVIDERGRKISYDYDGLSRLKNIRDNENNIIKRYDYGYAGQNLFTKDALNAALAAFPQQREGRMNSFFNPSGVPRDQSLKDTRLFFIGGAAQLPDDIKKSPTFYSALNFNLSDPYYYPQGVPEPRFKFQDTGYSVEWRLKFPRNSYNSDVILLGINFNFSIQILITQNGTYLYGYSDFDGRQKGTALGDPSFDILLDNATAFNNYQIVRLTITDNKYQVYYNGQLKVDYPRTNTVKHKERFYADAGFLGFDGSVDYIKVMNAAGVEKFKEDFTDPDHPVIPDPIDITPTPAACTVAFTNYFNKTFGTTKTFSEIAAIYLEQTGQSLSICP